MKKYLLVGVFFVFLLPGIASASTLTGQQISAVINLLEAFGVNQSTIAAVQSDLGGGTSTQNSQTQILSQLNEWQQQEQTDQSHLTVWQNALASSEAQWNSQCANLTTTQQGVWNAQENAANINARQATGQGYAGGTISGVQAATNQQQAENTQYETQQQIALNAQALQCSGIGQAETSEGQYISSTQNQITADQNEIDYLEALEK